MILAPIIVGAVFVVAAMLPFLGGAILFIGVVVLIAVALYEVSTGNVK
jgi:hypothetical protein